MSITYTVNPETFLVEIFSPDQELPFIHQPDWPTGDPFESLEDATAWAEEFVAYYNKETDVPPRNYKDHQPEAEDRSAPVEEVSPTEGTSEITAETAE